VEGGKQAFFFSFLLGLQQKTEREKEKASTPLPQTYIIAIATTK